jgi:thiol-disulfide isomerase/thioredoxin
MTLAAALALSALANPVVLHLDAPTSDGLGNGYTLEPADDGPDLKGRSLGSAQLREHRFGVVRRGRRYTLWLDDWVVPLSRTERGLSGSVLGGTVIWRPDLEIAVFYLLDQRLSSWDGTALALVEPVVGSGRSQLAIDGDGNGVDLDDARVPVGTPFRHAGSSWIAEVDGDRLILTPTDIPVAVYQRGQELDSLVVTDLAGETHDLAAGDRPRLLEFWGTWCGPCVAAIPKVAAAAEAHGLDVMGVAADSPAAVKAFLRRRGGPAWPQVIEGREGALHTAFNIMSWPSYALIDETGTVLYSGTELKAAVAAVP